VQTFRYYQLNENVIRERLNNLCLIHVHFLHFQTCYLDIERCYIGKGLTQPDVREITGILFRTLQKLMH